MRGFLTIVAIVFAIPLLICGTIYASGGKFILLHGGPRDVMTTAIVHNGPYIERADERPVKAGALGWIIFFPKLAGGLTLLCTAPGGLSTFPLSTASVPLYSDVTLDSCDHPAVLEAPGTHHFTPASPL
jgi:hypothetical protein